MDITGKSTLESLDLQDEVRTMQHGSHERILVDVIYRRFVGMDDREQNALSFSYGEFEGVDKVVNRRCIETRVEQDARIVKNQECVFGQM